MHRRRPVIALLSLLAALQGMPAIAEPRALVPDLQLRTLDAISMDAPVEVDLLPEMSEAELSERGQYLETKLAQNAHLTRLWFAMFTQVYSCGMLVQGARAAVATDPAERADLTASAAKALIGVVSRLAHPPRAAYGPIPMDLAPGMSHAARARRLLVAETMLRIDAKDNDQRFSWIGHTINVGLNMAAALVVGLGYHDWARGLESAGIGIAVGELSIWTQPWKAKTAWKEYQRRYGLAPRISSSRRPSAIALLPSVGRNAASGVLAISF